jgi:hypothetical protein
MSHKMNPMSGALPTTSSLHTRASQRSFPSPDSSPNSQSLAPFVHLSRGRKRRAVIGSTGRGRRERGRSAERVGDVGLWADVESQAPAPAPARSSRTRSEHAQGDAIVADVRIQGRVRVGVTDESPQMPQQQFPGLDLLLLLALSDIELDALTPREGAVAQTCQSPVIDEHKHPIG